VKIEDVKPGMHASVSNNKTNDGLVARFVYFASSKDVMDSAWAKRREMQAATQQAALVPVAPVQPAPASQPAVREDPTVGVPKRGATTQAIQFLEFHQQFLARAKQGNVDLLFLGDSITRGWAGRGKAVWDQRYEPLHAANFGIGGDRTQHVIWRIENGELEGIKPRVAVIMIGTNNSGNDSAEDIAAGVTKIVTLVRTKLPNTKVLLLAVFPRTRPNEEQRVATIKQVNQIISKLDDGKTVRYLDTGSKFLGPDGKVPTDIMPDGLHPNEKGYQIWADAMDPLLKEMLKS
jgi:lysophospholipase L1-like esterase